MALHGRQGPPALPTLTHKLVFAKLLFSGVFAPMNAPLVKGGTVCTTVSKRKLEGGFPQRVTDGTNRNLIYSN